MCVYLERKGEREGERERDRLSFCILAHVCHIASLFCCFRKGSSRPAIHVMLVSNFSLSATRL